MMVSSSALLRRKGDRRAAARQSSRSQWTSAPSSRRSSREYTRQRHSSRRTSTSSGRTASTTTPTLCAGPTAHLKILMLTIACQDHPLRAAASTLRTKAKQLLEFVTDPVASKPVLPSGRATSQHPASARHLAGIAAAEARWATRRGVDPSASLAGTDAAKSKAKANGVSFADEDGDAEESGPDGAGQEDDNVAFEERPALVRTAENMAMFVEAKEAWEAGAVAGPSVPRGLVNGDSSRRSASSRRSRSRSRPRTATDGVAAVEADLAVMEQDPILAEWATFVSPAMFAAGMPVLPLKERSEEDPEIGTPSTPAKGAANGIIKRRPTRKGKANAKSKGKGKAKPVAPLTDKRTLADEMRTNIATLRRIGKVHSKIATATATPRVSAHPFCDAPSADLWRRSAWTPTRWTRTSLSSTTTTVRTATR